MKGQVVAFAAGVVFSVGLGISGMTQPSKVIGFLDFLGNWDPSLAFVMGGAVMVNLIFHRLIMRRQSPLLGAKFHLPTNNAITARVIVGSALFGIGWGLGGFCPGPALTSLVTGAVPVLVFVGSMVAGMYLFRLIENLASQTALSE
ncbi:MAG: YeeE/YedE family protein [Bradymonadaceae bacterium]|nr:YeeE/YedE family protein [Lujinxingiaceae bacterium]